MKHFNLFLLLVIYAFSANSQSYVGETKIKRMPKMAIINELPYPADVSTNGIKKKMAQMGFTGKENDGYMVYRNVDIPELGPGKYNLYFKADRKSKKENDQSLVYMLISDSYDAFIDETRNSEVVRNGKIFLNTLNVQAESASVDKAILDAEEELKKAEKRFNNSVDDGNELEKRRRKIEEDIEQNKKDQEQKRLEVDRKKQELENARKRKQ